MDLKTQSSVGYAFINFIDPMFIPDFYLTFQQIIWSDFMPYCNSNKRGEIVYANMQGMEQIKKGLRDKNIMKKNDNQIKPIIYDQIPVKESDIQEIIHRYTQNPQFIAYFEERLK